MSVAFLCFVVRVERTLLSANVDLVFDLDLAFGMEQINNNTKVNGSGQECPLHTGLGRVGSCGDIARNLLIPRQIESES
jgi:hypothetical protein